MAEKSKGFAANPASADVSGFTLLLSVVSTFSPKMSNSRTHHVQKGCKPGLQLKTFQINIKPSYKVQQREKKKNLE